LRLPIASGTPRRRHRATSATRCAGANTRLARVTAVRAVDGAGGPTRCRRRRRRRHPCRVGRGHRRRRGTSTRNGGGVPLWRGARVVGEVAVLACLSRSCLPSPPTAYPPTDSVVVGHLALARAWARRLPRLAPKAHTRRRALRAPALPRLRHVPPSARCAGASSCFHVAPQWRLGHRNLTPNSNPMQTPCGTPSDTPHSLSSSQANNPFLTPSHRRPPVCAQRVGTNLRRRGGQFATRGTVRQPLLGSAPTTPGVAGRQRTCRSVQFGTGHRKIPNPGKFDAQLGLH